MKSVTILVFLMCLSDGYGLKCYKCISFKSWDDCALNRTEVTCAGGLDRCGKASVSFTEDGKQQHGFDKDCVSSTLKCDDWKKSDFCKDKECKITCCSEDLCNGVALPVRGSAIFISSFVIAYLF